MSLSSRFRSKLKITPVEEMDRGEGASEIVLELSEQQKGVLEMVRRGEVSQLILPHPSFLHHSLHVVHIYKHLNVTRAFLHLRFLDLPCLFHRLALSVDSPFSSQVQQVRANPISCAPSSKTSLILSTAKETRRRLVCISIFLSLTSSLSMS